MRTNTRWLAAAAAGLLLAGSGMIAAAAAVTNHADAGRPAAGPVPAGFEPASVTFVSASDGWVLGTAPCAHKPCTSVVRTTDGGRHWAGIPAPKFELASFGSAGLQRLRFADTSDGFAYGSQLWVTHNGGSSWHRVAQVPGSVVDLEAAAGSVYAAREKSGNITIYRSPAGSDAWSRVTGLPIARHAAGGLGIITLHGTAAWIILGNRLYSRQAGLHWSLDSVRCPRRWGMDSLAAYSSTQVTLLCSGDAALGQTRKALYASADGGTKFARVGSLPGSGDGGVLAEPTTRHLFAATSSGATWIYVSGNGGKIWHRELPLADGGKGWNDFGFTTPSQGVAIEGVPAVGSSLYLTWNAGARWHRVRF